MGLGHSAAPQNLSLEWPSAWRTTNMELLRNINQFTGQEALPPRGHADFERRVGFGMGSKK